MIARLRPLFFIRYLRAFLALASAFIYALGYTRLAILLALVLTYGLANSLVNRFVLQEQGEAGNGRSGPTFTRNEKIGIGLGLLIGAVVGLVAYALRLGTGDRLSIAEALQQAVMVTAVIGAGIGYLFVRWLVGATLNVFVVSTALIGAGVGIAQVLPMDPNESMGGPIFRGTLWMLALGWGGSRLGFFILRARNNLVRIMD